MRQTYQGEIECILVDDCSTDNTCEIVESYSLPLPEGKGVNNLTLLKQPKNNRQGAARNRGVSVAKGEYICFVDSDDAVTEGVIDAIRLAKEKQADMVAFHTANVNENGQMTKENERLSFPKGKVFSGVEMQNKHSYWFSGPVAYIYSKVFLDKTNYPFREGVLYEDSDFVMIHLYYAQRMAYSPALGYLAYYREALPRIVYHSKINQTICCLEHECWLSIASSSKTLNRENTPMMESKSLQMECSKVLSIM